MADNRIYGYYWVKINEKWEPALWNSKKQWILIGFEKPALVDEVGELIMRDGKKPTSEPDTQALPLNVVSFNEACECDNTEVCGICFRKKGYEIIDNELKFTGVEEVCDKCEEPFSYKGEYRNICFKCEDDFI
jgi:hypothetical protein